MSRATRTSRFGAAAVVAGLLVLTAPFLLRPAEAAPSQVPPLIPLETLLPVIDQLQPVLEVVSPIVWPLCANAVLVSVLPGALGLDIPPEVSLVTGPLLVLCGSVPEPLTNRRVCALDAQAQGLLAQLTTPILGSGLPIEVAPTKWLTGLLDNIVDAINLPGIPIGSTVAATLQCVDPPPETTVPLNPADVPPAAEVIELPPAPVVEPPTFAQLQTLPRVVPAPVVAAPVAPTPAASTSVPIVEPVVQFFSQPKFRYPVVMGLPLAFLGLLVFFGRALTRPLTASAPAPGTTALRRPANDGKEGGS